MVGSISNATQSQPVVPPMRTSAQKPIQPKPHSAPADAAKDSVHLSPAAQAALAAAEEATEATQAAKEAGGGDPHSSLK